MTPSDNPVFKFLLTGGRANADWSLILFLQSDVAGQLCSLIFNYSSTHVDPFVFSCQQESLDSDCHSSHRPPRPVFFFSPFVTVLQESERKINRDEKR